MAFASGEHPRIPSGPGGGEFTNAGSGGKGPAKQAKPPPHKPAHHGASHGAHGAHVAPTSGHGTLAYDPKSDHGPGYGSADGDSRVHTLQQTLNRLGLTDGHGKALKDDGKLGPRTTAAIKKLQTRLGVTADGQVTPAFLKSLAGMKTLPAHHHSTTKRGEGLTVMAGFPNTFVRSFALQDIAIRSGGDGRTVEAYAAVFDTPAEIVDGQGHYTEVIDRAAFNRTIANNATRVGVFYNHGLNLYGGASDRGSVPIGTPEEIRADHNGLLTVTRYNKTPLADEVLEAIRSGGIAGYSFTGRLIRSDPSRPPSGGFNRGRDGMLRTVRRHELGLQEYGPTPMPAYTEAAILGVRAAMAQYLSTITSTTPDEDLDPDDTGTPDDSGPAADEPAATSTSVRHSPYARRLQVALTARGIRSE